MEKTLKNKDKNLKLTTLAFTLIELLATIVILGLLALIVTPGVSKVIRNSKMNTAKASLEGYVREIENAVALYMTDNGVYPTNINQLEIDGKNISKIENPNVVFKSDGTISKIKATVNDFKCAYIENEGVTCQDKDSLPEITFDSSKCATTLTTSDEITAMNNKLDTCVNASGTISHTGTIESTNGTYNIVYTVTDTYGNTNTLQKTFTVELPVLVTYENFGDEIYYDPVNDVVGCTTYTESNSASGVVEGCLKWHVLSENEDGTVNLILDHNILSVKWYSSEDNSQGPTVAVEALNNAIKDKWSANLVRTDSYSHTFNNGTENKTYTVSYSGMKARLPEAGEIAAAVGYDTWNEDTATSDTYFFFDGKSTTRTVGYGKDVTTSDYAWLFNNLNDGSNSTNASNSSTCLYYGCTQNLGKTSGDYGYWTSTAVAGSSNDAWLVYYYGHLNYSRVAFTDRGVRPVITLNSNI